jgi:hypothetical protein
MKLTLAVLVLLAPEGLAQSREAAVCPDFVAAMGEDPATFKCPWDSLVANLPGECTPTATSPPPSPAATNPVVDFAQTAYNAGTATFKSPFVVKVAYLTDQYGTIIDYLEVDAEGDTYSFTVDGPVTTPVMGVVPHFFTADTCTDVYSTEVLPTWAGKIQAFSEKYDIGGTGYGAVDNKADQYLTVPQFSIGGGIFTASFAAGQGTESLAWVEDNLGNVLDLTESNAMVSVDLSATFEWPVTALTACRLFEKDKMCSSFDLVPLYMTEVSGLPAVGKEEVTSTKKVPYGKAAKATVVPTNATACANYIIYATKEDSDDLLAFGINQALEFEASEEALAGLKYDVYLTCDSATYSKTTVDTSLIVSTMSGTDCNGANDPLFCDSEVTVGYPACNAADGETAEEGEEIEVDGRTCVCAKGNLFCEKAAVGNYFKVSEAEAVGIAVTVSVIVLLLLMALIFVCLKKTAPKTELVGVLKPGASQEDAAANQA